MSTGKRAVPLLEVFSSFQGEGTRVGERQIFVRLSGCDLRCAFCDTPESFPAPPAARVQLAPDTEEEERVANPVALDRFDAFFARLDRPRGLHRAISITGGEPLLHPDAVRALADVAHRGGLDVHLETGGHRPLELERVLDVVDVVTPDLKLESATGQPTPWDAHAQVYARLAATNKALAVKAVVAGATSEGAVRAAAAFVHDHLPDVPFVLQPVTPFGAVQAAPTATALRVLHAAAHAVHPHVQVIPQVHRLLGVR